MAADPSLSEPDQETFVYDEFGYFDENCNEYGIDRPADLEVRRIRFPVGSGQEISGLRWGTEPPELVLLHGGAQNAHTWDTVLLDLDRPALAFDLPGHGHSDRRADRWYDPRHNAEAIISAWEQALVETGIAGPVLLVGMSLGGLTATTVAARRPDLVSELLVVDVTPGVTADKAQAIHDFIAGPQFFESFSAIFDRTVEFNPTRSASSLRRGILHNAHRITEGEHRGRWSWNYDREPVAENIPDLGDLWSDVGAVTVPYTLVRGALSPVVDDHDVEELLRRQPAASIRVAPNSGHSVQGDEPLLLSSWLRELLDRSAPR